MSAERLFRALLRLLPFDFRADYGKDIDQAFRDQCRDARRGGRPGERRVRWINFRDLAGVVVREHLSSLRRDTAHALRSMARQPAGPSGNVARRVAPAVNRRLVY